MFILPTFSDALFVAFSISVKVTDISWALLDVLSASFFTSSATTAKPLPTSPARAASIAAFRASKFICYVMDSIVDTIDSIPFDFSLN